jgi:hypothetical protein
MVLETLVYLAISMMAFLICFAVCSAVGLWFLGLDCLLVSKRVSASCKIMGVMLGPVW